MNNINDTDSENLQFITATAKDGNVFYIVIDKQNSNDNVYLLNKSMKATLPRLSKTTLSLQQLHRPRQPRRQRRKQER